MPVSSQFDSPAGSVEMITSSAPKRAARPRSRRARRSGPDAPVAASPSPRDHASASSSRSRASELAVDVRGDVVRREERIGATRCSSAPRPRARAIVAQRLAAASVLFAITSTRIRRSPAAARGRGLGKRAAALRVACGDLPHERADHTADEERDADERVDERADGGRAPMSEGRSERDVEGVGLAADWIAHPAPFGCSMTTVFPLGASSTSARGRRRRSAGAVTRFPRPGQIWNPDPDRYISTPPGLVRVFVQPPPEKTEANSHLPSSRSPRAVPAHLTNPRSSRTSRVTSSRSSSASSTTSTTRPRSSSPARRLRTSSSASA